MQRKQLFLLTLLSNLNIDVKLRELLGFQCTVYYKRRGGSKGRKIMGLLPLLNANHVLGLFCTY